jgi:PAS domain S-box-containing protein
MQHPFFWHGRLQRSAHVARRAGRRGAFLLFLALLDILVALSLASPPADVRANPAYHFIASILPLRVWAAIWAVTGLICAVHVFTRDDRVAYALACGLNIAWGCIYFHGWVFAGVERGWVGSFIWFAFGTIVAIISTWPEVPELHRITLEIGAIDISPDATITADRNGTITSWNMAAEQLLGWKPEEIIGKPITVLVPDRLRAQHQAGIERVRKTGHSNLAGQLLRLTAIHRNGSLIPIELTLGIWESKTGIAFTGVLRDARTVSVTVGDEA